MRLTGNPWELAGLEYGYIVSKLSGVYRVKQQETVTTETEKIFIIRYNFGDVLCYNSDVFLISAVDYAS